MIDAMLVKTYIEAMTLRPFVIYDKDWQLVCMLCTELPTFENGKAKRYEYDAAGHLLHLVNHAPNGSVKHLKAVNKKDKGRNIDVTYTVPSYATSSRSVSGANSAAALRRRAPKRARKCCASGKMSSRRSRSGGTRMWNTSRRW